MTFVALPERSSENVGKAEGVLCRSLLAGGAEAETTAHRREIAQAVERAGGNRPAVPLRSGLEEGGRGAPSSREGKLENPERKSERKSSDVWG